MTIAATTLRMDRSGNVRLALRCPAGAQTRCRGTVTLAARIAGRTRTVGAARVAARPGHKATVRVHLARKARTVVRRRHRLAVVATVRAKDAGGRTGVTRRALTVKPARR